MRFFSKINEHLGHLRSGVVERRDTVEAIYEHSETAQINAVDILEILSWCPERDSLTLTFNLDDEVVYSITSKTVEKLSSALKTSESCLCEYNELKIQIDKTVLDNRFSVFDLNSFAKDIIEQPLIEIMRWFSAKLEEQDYLVFDVFDSDISFSTGTMAFISSANSSFTPDLSRKERLSLCQESSFFHNMCTYRLIPEDFLIRGIGQIDNPFKSLFERMSTMLAIIYTASSALLSDSLLTVQISGHRTTSRNFTFKDFVFNKSWIALYERIYTDGNTTDKSIIAHNILSHHCMYADLLVID